MTAPKPPAAAADQPGPGPEQIPNLRAALGVDRTDPVAPMLIVALKNAGISVDFRVSPAAAPKFFVDLANAVMQTVMQLEAEAPPRIITPNGGAGGLFLPNGAKP